MEDGATNDERAFLRVENLHKRFRHGGRERSVLRGVTFGVSSGSFVSLLGPSGAGKTTLLRLVAGLEPADAGGVVLEGRRLGALGAEDLARLRRERVGYAPQFPEVLGALSPAENVALPLLIAGERRAAALERAEALLAALGLGAGAELRGLELSGLSGGERQRLSLARALVHRPRLLLVDEPTASLGSVEAEGVLELLRDLQRREGLSILLATINPRVAAHAERILRLKDGLLSEGAPLHA